MFTYCARSSVEIPTPIGVSENNKRRRAGSLALAWQEKTTKHGPDAQSREIVATHGYATVDPGEHHLCVKGSLPLWLGLALHGLDAKAGETHYFVIHLTSSGEYIELFFTEVDPDEGKELVARSKFSSSQTK